MGPSVAEALRAQGAEPLHRAQSRTSGSSASVAPTSRPAWPTSHTARAAVSHAAAHVRGLALLRLPCPARLHALPAVLVLTAEPVALCTRPDAPCAAPRPPSHQPRHLTLSQERTWASSLRFRRLPYPHTPARMHQPTPLHRRSVAVPTCTGGPTPNNLPFAESLGPLSRVMLPPHPERPLPPPAAPINRAPELGQPQPPPQRHHNHHSHHHR